MAQTLGIAGSRSVIAAVMVSLALAAGGCGGSGGGVDDRARVDSCVLTGATTNDGCDATIALGDLTIGALKTRDVALYNGGAGAVAATIGAVALQGGDAANYAIVKLYRYDASHNEVAVTLPYDLAVNHGSELRIQVAYTANAPVGAVSGVALRVAATHPDVVVTIPITGNVTGCPTGRGDCDGVASNGCEIDLQADMANCGACDAVCGVQNGGASCDAGTCNITCDAGFGNCDGSAATGCETDLTADVLHCSACGAACDATNGTPSCNAGACGIACATGFADCDGDPANGCEVDLATDAAHCGACGTACSAVNGTNACSAGFCVPSCDAGYASCDSNPANGCEAPLATDLSNCGACGTVCSSAGGTPSCAAGACQITCGAGFADCDGSVVNGCEVDTRTDTGNCGTCGTTCNATNGVASCTNAACGITCNAGFANCDGSASNGCEVSVGTDPLNCGACGRVCVGTNGTATCSNAVCGITCNNGFADCDADARTGCEVDLQSDLANCGACGHACGIANATPSCAAGACRLACASGYFDCNGANADGCEVNANTDAANCGGCGNVCVVPNGTPGCTASFCTVATCNPGFANCDLAAANGCEIDMTSDVNNCGGCSNVCSLPHASPVCSSGLCAVGTCDPGWADCDGNPANGCEVDLGSDLANCGTCGTVCGAVANGTPACNAGACGVGSCNPGFANCDGQVASGCEVNLGSDLNNCGSCGNVCAPGAHVAGVACTASLCQVSACQAGWYDVNGQTGDGCECGTAGTSASCAAPTSLGALSAGQTVTYTGNLVPAGQEAWLTVTFSGNTAMSYHPVVRFLAGGAEFRFAVMANCAGGAATGCGTEGGTSATSLTYWETYYTAGDPTTPSGTFMPIAPPGSGGTVLIRVLRAPGQPLTCNSYTLAISN